MEKKRLPIRVGEDGTGWLQAGITEIRKELNQWPEWKRTTAAKKGTKNK